MPAHIHVTEDQEEIEWSDTGNWLYRDAAITPTIQEEKGTRCKEKNV